MPQDDALLDFDTSALEHWDSELAHRNLAEFPELYRSHLAVARWLDGWIERLDNRPEENAAWALREVRAHLRQGDLLPNGVLFRNLG